MYRFYTSEEKAQAHLDAGVKRGYLCSCRRNENNRLQRQ